MVILCFIGAIVGKICFDIEEYTLFNFNHDINHDIFILVLHKMEIRNLMDDMEALKLDYIRLRIDIIDIIEIIQLVQQMNGCIDPFSEYFGSPLQDCLLQEKLQEKTAALQNLEKERVQCYTECRLRMEVVDEIQKKNHQDLIKFRELKDNIAADYFFMFGIVIMTKINDIFF